MGVEGQGKEGRAELLHGLEAVGLADSPGEQGELVPVATGNTLV